jgi:hypothetical protein
MKTRMIPLAALALVLFVLPTAAFAGQVYTEGAQTFPAAGTVMAETPHLGADSDYEFRVTTGAPLTYAIILVQRLDAAHEVVWQIGYVIEDYGIFDSEVYKVQVEEGDHIRIVNLTDVLGTGYQASIVGEDAPTELLGLMEDPLHVPHPDRVAVPRACRGRVVRADLGACLSAATNRGKAVER